MPWKYNNTVIKEGREFIGTDGTQYPKVWMRYSADEKKAIGITWEDPPASEAAHDNRFYSGRQTDGTLIEKESTNVCPSGFIPVPKVRNVRPSNEPLLSPVEPAPTRSVW